MKPIPLGPNGERSRAQVAPADSVPPLGDLAAIRETLTALLESFNRLYDDWLKACREHSAAEATVARQTATLALALEAMPDGALVMRCASGVASKQEGEQLIASHQAVDAALSSAVLAGLEAPAAESREKDACMRCGSTEWTDVDYSGCSNCREAPDVASDGVHTIPVPRGWTPEQAWEAISHGDMLIDAEPSSWANVLIRDGKFVELVSDG